jgi:hypothetical protein
VCSTVLSNFQEILINVSPFFLLLVVLFLGLYVFWRGCSETRKDTSSIFDVFTISLFLGLILGRISYVIANWSSFTSFIWYWLPYEKYGDEIYLFRVLPWRFFRVWDWGIDILTMFVGFLLVASLWVLLVKKWKWSHLFTTIFFTAQVMLAISFVLLGGVSGNEQWIIQGAVMMLLPAVLFFLKNSVKKIMIGNKEIRVLAILDVIFIVLTVIYTAYTYLAVEISDVEKGGVITFVVWTLLGTIYYLYDLRKDKVTIEKVSSVRVVSPVDVNQPVKLPQNEND